MCEATTMAESEIRQATNVPACDSVTCALGQSFGQPTLGTGLPYDYVGR